MRFKGTHYWRNYYNSPFFWKNRKKFFHKYDSWIDIRLKCAFSNLVRRNFFSIITSYSSIGDNRIYSNIFLPNKVNILTNRLKAVQIYLININFDIRDLGVPLLLQILNITTWRDMKFNVWMLFSENTNKASSKASVCSCNEDMFDLLHFWVIIINSVCLLYKYCLIRKYAIYY